MTLARGRAASSSASAASPPPTASTSPSMPGEVHAVIGPNGAGKTTLINQLSGELAPDAGSIRFDGREITREPVYRRALLGLGRSYQITSVFPEFTRARST